MKFSHKELLDTDSIFYSNVDRLVSIIENTLEKNQVKNAERYLKYFFEVLVKFYSRIDSVSQSIDTEFNVEIKPKKFEANEPIEIIEAANRFERRKAQHGYDEFFEDKLRRLLFKNIKSGNQRVFHFILSLFKDSIIALSKSEKAQSHSYKLTYLMKFLSNQILGMEPTLTAYEKGYYNNEIIEWFIDSYIQMVDDTGKLNIVTTEMLYILKGYIDNKRIDLFSQFVNRLSSAFFFPRYYYDEQLKKFLDRTNNQNWDVRYQIQKSEQKFKELMSPRDFEEKIVENEKWKYNLLVNDLGIKDAEARGFLKVEKSYLFGLFKEEYLRVLLAKAIVYSFFKEDTSYFMELITYHQPEDSDAIWSGKNYGSVNLQDLRFFITNKDDIIGREFFIWTGHHGFEVYLNTYIAYFIYVFYKKHNVKNLASRDDSSYTINVLHSELSKLKVNVRFDLLLKITKHFNKEEYENIIDALITSLDKLGEEIQVREIRSYNFEKNYVDKFKKDFIDQFHVSASIRNIFAVNNLIENTTEINAEKELGVNTYIDKRVFVEQNDISFIEFPQSIANSFANSENFNILFSIEENCKKETLAKKHLAQFITENKSKYDIIISKKEYLSNKFIPELAFTESWYLTDSVYKNNPDFRGILDNHYSIFYIRNYPIEELVFLNSNNIGKLIQFKPQVLADEMIEDIFSFSIVDLSREDEVRRQHLQNNTNVNEQYLLKQAWLKIYESFEYCNDYKDIGMVVQIDYT